MNPIFEHVYHKNDDSSTTAEEIRTLLNHVVPINDGSESEKEFIGEIISNFSLEEPIKIDGSHQAITDFLSQEINKFDAILGVSDLVNLDFPIESGMAKFVPTRYLKFDILGEDSNRVGNKNIRSIYRAKQMFLDYFYSIDKFTDFALSYDFKFLVLNDFKSLNENQDILNRKAKFRFIEANGETYFRSLVSQGRYKTFDNSIVFYIVLSKISEFSKNHNLEFDLNYMYMTDSKLELTFMETTSHLIDDSISIQTGINVTNSELGDGAAVFNFVYKIINNKNQNIMLQRDVLAKINHGHAPHTISRELEQIDDFISNREELIKMLENIDWKKNIEESSAEYALIFTRIQGLQRSRSLPKDAKTKLLNAIDSKSIANKVINLLQIFGMLSKSVEDESREVQRVVEDRLNKLIVEISHRNFN
ncbi:hypothetical protein [Fructobacillus evanidus]|uniref:Uncharacterized protein n=1 Tax=Fructobacillus evanidus TaxID=3064281 RepID=A0ABN9YS39_9LACO|nr:hypothetical protein R55250_KEHBDPNM_00362 [Fructobacillus sp. LMG 32999]CAK1237158.1 hypothetical protein R53718_MFFEMHAI_00997 [Fructobacillus sp. LMG 32999]CAK1241732.1 hypothetical protein R55214_HHFBAMCI_00859 [Fructobacillus sp. LMG 32999]CAK1244645.1 hypothetical protein R54837_OMAIDLJD_00994 [Fructobacillus sp. LMG 32999]CAK1246834.1 hypothetical protein R55203_MFJFHIJN_01094 [Fructobacillus sp. LMG 32999]